MADPGYRRASQPPPFMEDSYWRSPEACVKFALRKGQFSASVYKTDVLSKLSRHHFISLFSQAPISGTRIINKEKYRTDAICPISINGGSTGFPPIQVRIRVLLNRSQNRSREGGRKVRLRCLDV